MFWPPVLPPFPEDAYDPEALPLVPRSDYIEFIANHPELNPMPREMRLDLDPLPIDI
jgi:hypothetical protein